MCDRVSMVVGLLKPDHGATEEERNEYKKMAGDAGEDLTQILLDYWNCVYFKIEQGKGTKPKWLKCIRGKRPDFIVFTDTQDELIIDSKYRDVNKEYATIEVKEINELRKLTDYLDSLGKITHTIFIYPIGGMNPDRFYCIPLEDFENGDDITIETKDYKRVSKKNSFSMWDV